ncbi:serine/threonine protein kinase [Clostridium sp. DJ247]|uniref:serine/threonine protein kinase n=1 Tax=Clostridium sp. DJ247 TaxID=2726188 RepID=UPI00162A5156|nr:serine/threonine protein kinase [Clostridium sp. DJ247]MBC2579341.1 serine/threonine protein kinase [Clostridium sp. DJ247]
MEYIDLNKCKYLGHGRCGKVYLTPDGRAMKICKTEEECNEEYKVLKLAQGSEFFPIVYEKTNNIIIRQYVEGENLKKYVKKHGLSKKLATNLINLIEEFRRLGFRRLDMRGEHILVRKDESVMVIDPSTHLKIIEKKPRRMLRDLKRCKVEKKFYHVLKNLRPDLYKRWK